MINILLDFIIFVHSFQKIGRCEICYFDTKPKLYLFLLLFIIKILEKFRQGKCTYLLIFSMSNNDFSYLNSDIENCEDFNEMEGRGQIIIFRSDQLQIQ